jgi:hypothetical protein
VLCHPLVSVQTLIHIIVIFEPVAHRGMLLLLTQHYLPVLVPVCPQGHAAGA